MSPDPRTIVICDEFVGYDLYVLFENLKSTKLYAHFSKPQKSDGGDYRSRESDQLTTRS